MPGNATPAAAPAAAATDPNTIDVQATEVPADKDFADAFLAATTDAPAAPAPAPAIEAPAVGATGDKDDPAASAPASGAPSPAPAAPAAAPAGSPADDAAAAAQAPAAAPAAAPTADNNVAAGGPTIESLQAEIAALRAAQAQPPAAPAAPAAAPAAADPPLYSDDEKAVVDAYKSEWPDVAAGEALIRRAEHKQLLEFVFSQIKPHLDQLYAQSGVAHERTQYQILHDMVPDYDDIRDPTLAWINAQPAYLKEAYMKVANEGTPEQVADIISRFRKETGWVKPGAAAAAPTPAAPAAAPAPTTAAPAAAAPTPAASPAVSSAVAAAAAALKPVGAVRSSTTTAADPNDFEGAFAEAAKSLGQ